MKIRSTTSVWNQLRLLCIRGAIVVGMVGMVAIATMPSSAKPPAKPTAPVISPPSASAAALLPGAWQRVYEQLPNFPREDQYFDLKAGAVKPSNNLVNRMIKYHIFVKGRVPSSRIDWKLTLADYLGINEIMYETRYPGFDELKKNPFDRDLAVIRSLSRSQRDALVEAMVKSFTPATTTQPTASAPSPKPPAPAIPNAAQERLPKSPKAGDANLLKL